MTTEPADIKARAGLLQRGGRFAFPVPDALLALIFALAALIDFLTPEQLAHWPAGFIESRDELMLILMVEGGFLMMQGTLVDIATRLKKRPPIWLIPIILGAVVLFSGHSFEMLKMAWREGGVVFTPMLLSLAERGTMLWTMPDRSRIQKIAARALIANRITTALGIGGLATIAMLIAVATGRFDTLSLGSWPLMLIGAVYFTVAAFDDWRVRGPAFAEYPRVLFRFDPIGITYLDPM